jgi:hypothetical protein
MTGTQGWVKYRLRRDSDGAGRALIYLYWTNPYLGVTRPRCRIVGQDLVADCDQERPGAGSSFSGAVGENDPPSDLSLQMVGARKNGSPTTAEDLDDLILVAFAPFVVLGTAGIWERMEIDYRISSSAPSTLLPPPKPRTRSLETKPDPSTFVGTWTGASLSVSLALVGPRKFRVRVVDQTQAVPLELEADTALGESGATIPVQHMMATLALQFATESSAEALQTSAALHILAASMQHHGDRSAGTPSWKAGLVDSDGGMVELVSRAAVQARARELGVETFPGMEAISAAVAENAREANYMLHLGSGIALYLVRIEEDGQLIDYKLHYQRTGGDAAVLVDTDLSFVLSSVH